MTHIPSSPHMTHISSSPQYDPHVTHISSSPQYHPHMTHIPSSPQHDPHMTHIPSSPQQDPHMTHIPSSPQYDPHQQTCSQYCLQSYCYTNNMLDTACPHSLKKGKMWEGCVCGVGRGGGGTTWSNTENAKERKATDTKSVLNFTPASQNGTAHARA